MLQCYNDTFLENKYSIIFSCSLWYQTSWHFPLDITSVSGQMQMMSNFCFEFVNAPLVYWIEEFDWVEKSDWCFVRLDFPLVLLLLFLVIMKLLHPRVESDPPGPLTLLLGSARKIHEQLKPTGCAEYNHCQNNRNYFRFSSSRELITFPYSASQPDIQTRDIRDMFVLLTLQNLSSINLPTSP